MKKLKKMYILFLIWQRNQLKNGYVLSSNF